MPNSDVVVINLLKLLYCGIWLMIFAGFMVLMFEGA